MGTYLRERKTKSRAEDNGKEGQPTKAQSGVPWKAGKRLSDQRTQDAGNWFAHNRGWDESENNDPGGNENVTEPIKARSRWFTTIYSKRGSWSTHRIKVQAQNVCAILERRTRSGSRSDKG